MAVPGGASQRPSLSNNKRKYSAALLLIWTRRPCVLLLPFASLLPFVSSSTAYWTCRSPRPRYRVCYLAANERPPISANATLPSSTSHLSAGPYEPAPRWICQAVSRRSALPGQSSPPEDQPGRSLGIAEQCATAAASHIPKLVRCDYRERPRPVKERWPHARGPQMTYRQTRGNPTLVQPPSRKRKQHFNITSINPKHDPATRPPRAVV